MFLLSLAAAEPVPSDVSYGFAAAAGGEGETALAAQAATLMVFLMGCCLPSVVVMDRWRSVVGRWWVGG